MDRDAVRAMGMTDATPFLENADSHWAAISGWIEDSGDLGDAEEFEEREIKQKGRAFWDGRIAREWR